MYDRHSTVERRERAIFWSRWLFGLAFWEGGGLSLATLVLFSGWAPQAGLLWTVVLILASAVAAATKPLTHFLATALPLFGALGIVWALSPSPFALTVLAVLGSFLLLLLRSGHTLSRGNHSRAELGLRNEALARQLEEQNRKLEGLARTRSALLAGASHDLRQPAHALGLIMEIIDPRQPAGLDHQLKAARSCLDALSEMMTQLLDFARMDLALYSVVKQGVAVHELVREVGRSLEPTARAKGLVLQVTVQETWALSDVKLLRRSLFNLVTNAIEFTDSGKVGIVCELQGGRVVLYVQDTGQGIEPDRLGQIFGEYVTTKGLAQETQHGAGVGLGLGLSVVNKACRLLGHEIQVSSHLGHGSRFILQLGAQQPTPWREPLWEPDISVLRGVLVAVIEDDATIRMSLQLTLTRWGCEVVSAGDLKTLVRKLALNGRAPQLIMTELHLKSARDGLVAVQQLRRAAAREDVPAIIITGDLSPEVERHTRAANIALAYKPLSPRRIQQLLVSLMVLFERVHA